MTDRPVRAGRSESASPGGERRPSPRREARRARERVQRPAPVEEPRSDPTWWTDPPAPDPVEEPPSRGRDAVLDLDLLGVRLHLPVVPAAWLLIAVGVLLTAARLARGWFWQDDLALLAGAADHPLGPGLLFTGYNGHLIPGTWLVAWFVDAVAPLQWWPAATATLLLTAAVDVSAFALFRRLFGTRPAILLPLALVCTSPLTLMPTLWWAAAMQWLPVTAALAAGLYFHVGYLGTGRVRDAAGAVLSSVAGLLFFEKGLTTVVVLALFTVAYGVSGPVWRRPFTALVRYLRYWLAHAAVVVLFLVGYLTTVTITTQPGQGSGSVWTMVRYQVLDTVIPSFVGGPLSWYTSPGNISAWPHPPLPLALPAWALALAAVVVSIRLRRGAWRAWVLLAIFYAISATLVAQARLGVIGPFIGRDQRYVSDLVLMVPLCLALAWLPLRAGLDRGSDDRKDPLAGDARLAAVGAVAVVLCVAGSVVSGERFMAVWGQNPAPAYFERLNAGLASGDVAVYGKAHLPDTIMTSAFGPVRDLDRLAPMLPTRPAITDHAERLVMPDDAGRLKPVTVRGVLATVTQPAACGVAGRDATAALPAPALGYDFTVKIGYLAQADTSARVSVGDADPVTVQLRRGLHDLYVYLPRVGGAPVVTVAGLGASVCIGSAAVGQAAPTP